METALENVRLLRQGTILKEWWSEVKENFWEQDARERVKELLKSLMEQTLIEDLELKRREMPGPAYRNGYYPRTLVTQFGLIQGLQVPRLREEAIPNRIFSRYERHQTQVEDLIQEVFLV